jgi:hypothetical protein
MPERGRENNIGSVAEVFAQKIEQRTELPIVREDAYHFAIDILGYNPPHGFLERLAKGLSFMDRPNFEREIGVVAEKTREIIGSDPYLLLLPNEDSSNRWIYELLLQKGIQPAVEGIDFGMIGENRLPFYWRTWFKQNIPKGYKTLIADDFSFSDAQIKDEILLEFDYPNYDNSIILFGATNKAIQNITRLGKSVKVTTCGQKIDNLPEIFQKKDCQFLRHVDELTEPSFPHGSLSLKGDALFWTWYKVPDNVLEIFTGKRKEIRPLIRPGNFKQPYRN